MQLRTLREAAGLSLSKAAAHLDVDASTLCRWEQGIQEPRDAENIPKLISSYVEETEKRAQTVRRLAKLSALSLLLLLPSLAAAQNARYDGVVQGPRGPVAFANIAVCTQPSNTTTQPCSPLASLGTSLAGGSGPNPLLADLNGNFRFYAPPALYTIQIYSPQISPAFSGQITSTLATGTAPFSISSTTVVPNLNSQLHNGKTAPAGNIVGDTDTQTLTNKTLDCTANTLSKNPCVVYSTASASTNASIGPTTMATAGASGNTYRFSWYADQTASGTSCTGNSTFTVNWIWTDPGASSTSTVSSAPYTIINNGAVGAILNTPTSVSFLIRAKASTSVQYSTTFTPGASCSPAPSYQVYPALQLLQ